MSDAARVLASGDTLHRLHGAKLVSAAADLDSHDQEHLAMLFEGGFQLGRGATGGFGGGTNGGNLVAPILCDTGATCNFAFPRLLRQMGVAYSPSSATLRLADDSTSPILGKARIRFKVQTFTTTVTCFVTDLCDEFDLILGNSFMISHRAVLDYANFTASFRRHGRLHTLIPSRIPSDIGNVPVAAPAVDIRTCPPIPSVPSAAKDSKRVNRADQHAEYSHCFKDLNPKCLLSCAQARRSINRGCRSFLVMVTEADVAAATLATATASPSAPAASATTVDPEQADLLQHVDEFATQICRCLC